MSVAILKKFMVLFKELQNIEEKIFLEVTADKLEQSLVFSCVFFFAHVGHMAYLNSV